MNAKNPRISLVSLQCLLTLTVFMVILPAQAQMTSQGFGIPVSTVDSGGGRQGSSHFEMQNSMGQPMPPGVARSENFGLFAGLQSCIVEELVLLKGQRGDVDNNGDINVLDILAVANHILGIVTLTGEAYQRADCDGNSTINILDALGIANVILGIFPACPGGAGKIRFSPEAMELLESLKYHFRPGDFAALMDMARDVQIPDRYALDQNYPNPFNLTTSIQLQIPNSKSKSPAHTTLAVYNILGQEVRVLVDEVKEAGYYSVTWDGRDGSGHEMASGVYFYRLTAGEFRDTKRMMLVK
jgi:hypothetical protein